MGIEPSASPKSLNPIENLEKRDKNRDEEQWRSDSERIGEVWCLNELNNII